MLSLYPAIFYKEKDFGYSVIFPDLNHLATCGEDLQEAMEMAIDCLAGYIYSARLDGETLPAPTEVENIDIHCEDDEYSDYESAFVNVVAVDVDEYAAKHFEIAVKKTLTVPEKLNQIAINKGINFSAILKERLMEVCGFKSSDKDKNSDTAVSELLYGEFKESSFLQKLMPFGILPVLGGGVVGAVGSNEIESKTVKKTVTIPKWLNEEALAQGVNFSAVMKESLILACKS